MKLLIHDLEENVLKEIIDNNDDIIVISNTNKINKCVGCFGCWIKTPATCVIKDGYKDMGKLISKCEELIIVSKCTYGGYSPFVKNVIDRSISYIHPYFTTREGQLHHKSRYKDQIKLSVYFYGNDITVNEKETAKKLVKAHGLNFNVKDHNVEFYTSFDEIRGDII